MIRVVRLGLGLGFGCMSLALRLGLDIVRAMVRVRASVRVACFHESSDGGNYGVETPSPVWQEFRHFVRILVPPQEVPSYMELVVLYFIDIKHAFKVS